VLQSIARLLDGFVRGKISRSSLRWLSGMVVSVGSTTELGVCRAAWWAMFRERSGKTPWTNVDACVSVGKLQKEHG